MNWIGLHTNIIREIQRFLRVAIQTLVSPWISAALYIFVFGFIVGSRIAEINGVRYIEFVMPGVLMLNVISSSFSQTSSSLYFGKFVRYIEEMLVAPLSSIEIVTGFLVGGIVRGVAVGIGVYAIAIFFGAAGIEHPILFLLYSVVVAAIFSLLGLLIGLWSDSFEQLSMLNTFVITPLTFLGGVFNSIDMLPTTLQSVMRFNPFFYFVDGLRYSMTGIQESNLFIGWVLISFLLISFGFWVWVLFSRGYKIRS